MRVWLAAMMCSAGSACVIAAAVALTWCLPSAAIAVEVAIGQPPNANTIVVTAASGERNALTIARDASTYTIGENGPPTMTPGAGCTAGPSPNTSTCPAGGISQLYITLGDADDGVTVATSTNAVILGGTGNDKIIAGAGNDSLYGDDVGELSAGSGADRLEGGGGDDVLNGGRGPDSLFGGPGNDALDPGLGGPAENDILEGDEGDDRVSYGLRSLPVVTTKDGIANDGQEGEGDDIRPDVERITGGLANDSVGGGADADVLDGGPGDDTVNGFDGDDELHGDGGLSAGADTLVGGSGNDRLYGEAGPDTLGGGPGNDMADGGTGSDALGGGPGADQLFGGPERDAVTYDNEPDVTVRLDKGVGGSAEPGDSDLLIQVEDATGGLQRDTLTGSSASNALDGRSGEDYLDGRLGVDRLDGGSSADVVVARDRVRDEPVSCGPGQDLAIIDEGDRAVRGGQNRCEQVDDGRHTKPRPGWVYVHPHRCVGSAKGVELGLPAMHRLVPLRYSILLRSGYRRRPPPTLDAATCPVRLRATVGQGRSVSADVSGGAVTVGQTPARRVTTTLTVKRSTCAPGGRTEAVARDPEVRVSTDRRRGRWKVKGKFSIAAAVGTDWTTLEGCSRTVTVVRRGRVEVYDRAKRRTVTVRAGHRYVARRGRTSK
jgi:Ca2+-binding RTX toxin-like protein